MTDGSFFSELPTEILALALKAADLRSIGRALISLGHNGKQVKVRLGETIDAKVAAAVEKSHALRESHGLLNEVGTRQTLRRQINELRESRSATAITATRICSTTSGAAVATEPSS